MLPNCYINKRSNNNDPKIRTEKVVICDYRGNLYCHYGDTFILCVLSFAYFLVLYFFSGFLLLNYRNKKKSNCFCKALRYRV